ncbi:ras-related protein Rab-44 isoform X2 [Macrotis lagotis]|uniref:ras-related protein Rab-44 isoform X2 n=1 Tax=Macrotis lagotis TaxID=92651 RepID=UPI003D698E46
MENNPRAGRKSRKLGSRRRHQMRTVADEEDPSAPDTEQLPSQVTEELQDFFRECGAEHKGFITREDLRKAKFSFVSSPEELELIFDWMDLERKGRLTSKEFTSGFKNVFSSQTRIPGPRKRKTRTWIFSKEEPTSFQPLEEADPEERRWFLSFMEQLGTDHLILDQTEIWQLWKKLRQEEPHLVGNLEGFLAKVTSRLQETRAEKEALQMTLKKCDDDHHREVQQLYEEMEQQIHSEKQRIQAELEAQINLLRSKRHEVSMENQRLQETQRALTGQLEQVQGQLQVTRRHLNQAKGQVVWQVEEETSLPSDPPVGPKNISDSQHASLFSEEDPLPSLFEEGDWSQLLKNFTSPLAGNSTQVSWSLTPTPTSLQGHRTPRVVKQISITKSNSWQLNQESPSDPDVPPRSSPGSSAASAVVSELNVADDPRSEVIFQWDFQRVPSGEPAITTGGQAAPLLGESLASLDSLPSQGLDGSGKGIEDTDGDEVRQGDGPTSNMFSKGPGSEVSQQSLVLSADVQASTWKVHPKMSHSGLHPAGSEQEVGSWGKEVFTPGPDGPVKTPELVLIQGSTSKREQEQEKMNTDEWEVETSPRNDASDQETGLRESPGSDVGEVPGEGSRSRELPIPDVGEVYGERSRSSESPVSDVGEVPGEGFGNTEILESEVGEVLGEGSRNRESPVPDVGEVPGERPSSIESSGPDVGEFPAEGARSIESPRPDESEVPGEGSRSRESPVPIVGDVPGEESKGSESSGPDVGEVPGERSRHTESPGQDMGEVPGEGSRSTESPGPDVENAPSQEAGLTESPAPDIGNHHTQETSHVESSRPYVDGALSQEDQILGSLELDVEAPGEETQFIHLTRVMQPPEIDTRNIFSEKESKLIISPRADADNASGQEARVLELVRLDMGNVSCEEVRILDSDELEKNNHSGQEFGLLQSPDSDVYVYPSYEVRLLGSNQTGIGDTIESNRLIMRNALDLEAGLTGSPGSYGNDVPGQETRFMESWELDIKDSSDKETQVLQSPDPDVGEIPRQENVLMNSPEPDVADDIGQEAWIGIGDAAVQEARVIEMCKGDVGNASDQGSGLIESPELHVDDTSGQENVFFQSDETDMEDISGQKAEILYSLDLDLSDVPGQKARYRESLGSNVSDVAIQENGFMNSSVINQANSTGQEDKFVEFPEIDMGMTAIQESEFIDGESCLDVRNTSGQETRLSETSRSEDDGTFLYSPGPDVGDAFSEEARLVEQPRMDIDVATVQGTDVTELSKINVGNGSDQETRFIRSVKMDAPSGEIGLIELPRLELGNASGEEARLGDSWEIEEGIEFSQEAKFKESWEIDMGNAEITEIIYSSVPAMSDSLDQEAGIVELHGLYLSETSIQEARVLESIEKDMGDGSEQGVVIRESYEAGVGNPSAQDIEILHTPGPRKNDSPGPKTEILHSPGLYMGDSIVQEAGVTDLYKSNVGNAPDQETSFIPSSKTDVNDAADKEVGFRESYMIDRWDNPVQEVGLKESSMLDLKGTPGQEDRFIELPETCLDDKSNHQVEQTGSPGPDVRDVLCQEGGFRESYETDEEDILGLMESTGLGEIPSQEGSFLEFPEENVDDSSQVTGQPGALGPDVKDTPDQEAGFREYYEKDMKDVLGKGIEFGTIVGDAITGQGILMLEKHKPDVGDASAQDTDIIYLSRSGISDSADLKVDSMQLPDSYVIDSIAHGAGVIEFQRPDGRNTSDQETRFMPSSEAYVRDAPPQEAEILPSDPGLEDSSRQESGFKESSSPSLVGAPGQEDGLLESSEASVHNEPDHQVGQTGSPGSDVREALGQEGDFGESCEIDEEETLGLMESRLLGETPSQEGSFLKLTEEGVNDGSSQITEQTGSFDSDVREAPAQGAGFRKSFETDLRDTLGKEVEFGSDGGDAIIGQGILVLEKHEPNPGDASRPDQTTGLTESYEPEIDDISSQETEIMHSPGSNRCDAFGWEAKFRELCETDVGDTENAEIMYSPVPDISDIPGENETPIQDARVLESLETDVSDGPDQEARFLPSETDLSDAADQEAGFRESYVVVGGDIPGQEAEILHSSGSEIEDSCGQKSGFKESSVLDLGGAPGQEGRFMESSEAGVDEGPNHQVGQIVLSGPDVRDALGQEGEFSESCEIDEEDTLGFMESTKGSFLELPDEGGDDGSIEITELTGPDVGDAPDQEIRFRKSYETDLRDALGKEVEFGIDGGDMVTDQGILMLEKHEPNMGNASRLDQITGFIDSFAPEMSDIPRQETEIMQSTDSDRFDAFGEGAKFRELCETDVGDAENAEIMYSQVPDMSGFPHEEAGIVEIHGLYGNETLIQEGRVLESPEIDVSDGPGQEVVIRDSYEKGVGNTSVQDTEIMHSLRPSVNDSAGSEAEKLHLPDPNVRHSMGQEAGILHSPGPEVKDSPGQEVRLKKSSELDLGGTPGQEGRFMESSEAGMDDGSNHQDEQTKSPGSDVREALGQEGDFGESCEVDEEETLGLMESRLLGSETPSQEGSFLEFPEENVDASSQVTEQPGSPGPDVKDTPDQEAGFREYYEKDMKDMLGKGIEFGTIVGDTITGQEILMLEKQELDVGDASRPNQITGFIESYGPEIGDIPSQEAEIMHSPGSDRCDAFGPEAKFRELCETDVEDTENAEIIYSPVPDISDIPGENETPIQEARVLESLETDVSDGPDQEARFLPSETDLSDAADQEAGFRESYVVVGGDIPGQEAEILHSSGSEIEDSSGQESGFKEASVLDLGGAPGQEGRFIESSKEAMYDLSNHQVGQVVSPGPDVKDALGQEGEFRKSSEIDEEDSLGFMESTGLGETPSKNGIFLESPKEDVNDGSSQVTEQAGSLGSNIMDVPGQEAGVMELHNLYVSETPLQKTKVLGLSEIDLSDGPGQEVVIREAHEANVGDTSAQDIEIIYSPRSGVNDSVGLEVESMQSPDSYVVDSIVQEAGATELQRSNVRNTSDQEIRCMSPSEADVRDTPGQEAEVLPSGPEVKDSPGQKFEFKASPVPNLGGAPGQKDEHVESLKTSVDNGSSPQVGQTRILEPDERDTLDLEGGFSEFYEIDEEETLGLMEAEMLHLRDTPSEERKFLESPEEVVNDGSGQVTEQARSPGLDLKDVPGQEAGFRKSYEKDMRDVLAKEGEFLDSFLLDGGDTITGQEILMLETHEPDVRDTSSQDQIAGFIESCGPEMGDIPSQVGEIVYSLSSDRCDAFGQGAKLRELHEMDVEDTEIMCSPVSDVCNFPGQEVGVVKLQGLYVSETSIQDARVLESPETDVSDGPGQEKVIRESYEEGVGDTSAQDTEILHSFRPSMSDSTGPEPEILHSPGPYIGQEAGVIELHRRDVENAPDQETRFMPSSETDVRYPVAQETGLTKSSVPDLRGAPVQESRFLELPEAGVIDWSCQQIGQIGSPGLDVRHAPGQENEILHSPSHDVGDYCHQGTGRFIDSSRPIMDILSAEEVHLPQSPGPDVGDAPEEKSGDNQSPRPDVLPVIPEHGGLQDQNPEDVWRAEDRGLQKQAQEGVLFPKDSSGNTLDPQDSGQDLSIPMEAGAQSGSKVPRKQITCPSSEPREESRPEVTKETRHKPKAQAAGTSPGRESSDPDYLFHVLFLGDSNVGKTSFLHLLHHDSFASGLTATVGMDYRIKNLVVDNRRFALQLWDTAGQERYHSITKQFLRKADGIVLMYDVTCPGSFTHVRYWLDCIQEAGPDDVVILLLGNKIDCVEKRLVSTEAGQLLAKEIGVTFGECSAALGHNILEPIVTLARAMKEQDTKLKHSMVDLERKEMKKKSGCCS